MNALAHTIATSIWLMHRPSAEAYLPAAARLLAGEQVSFYDTPARKVYAYNNTVGRSPNCEHYDIAKAPAGSVLVIPIRGAIMKNDGYCGEMGTETMMRLMRKAERMDNIAGYLLEIDSGGGEATNIETTARFIRTVVQKPVVAHITGICASAAYWLAAAADKVYAAQGTNWVGSIGAMFTMMDYREALEKEGVKLHEIYATQSTLKNDEFKAARDGDYDKLKKNMLDPMAASFIDSIKQMRPDMGDGDAYRGKLYSAMDAITIGMIDGVRPYEASVQAVLDMAGPMPTDEDNQPYQSENNPNNMNRIQQLLGYELEQQDGGAFLQQHELDKINKFLAMPDTEVVEAGTFAELRTQLDAQTEQIEAINAQIEALSTKLEDALNEMGTLRTQADANSQAIEAYAKNPGEVPATAFAEADPDTSDTDDAYDAFEAQMRSIAAGNGRIVITH